MNTTDIREHEEFLAADALEVAKAKFAGAANVVAAAFAARDADPCRPPHAGDRTEEAVAALAVMQADVEAAERAVAEA